MNVSSPWLVKVENEINGATYLQYIPHNMHPILLHFVCYVCIIRPTGYLWSISPYPPGLLHWHWDNYHGPRKVILIWVQWLVPTIRHFCVGSISNWLWPGALCYLECFPDTERYKFFDMSYVNLTYFECLFTNFQTLFEASLYWFNLFWMSINKSTYFISSFLLNFPLSELHHPILVFKYTCM